jgi:hypothetical protein
MPKVTEGDVPLKTPVRNLDVRGGAARQAAAARARMRLYAAKSVVHVKPVSRPVGKPAA